MRPPLNPQLPPQAAMPPRMAPRANAYGMAPNTTLMTPLNTSQFDQRGMGMQQGQQRIGPLTSQPPVGIAAHQNIDTQFN